MAIDTQSARVLLAARKAGVDFARTVTLGRQSYFPKRRHLVRALEAAGFGSTCRHLADLPKGYSEEFLLGLGAQTVDSIDASDYENATLIHDLNLPVPKEWHGRYTVVFDGGTSEHVYHYPQAIANAMDLTATGGHVISITAGNNLPGHGFYQISPELFFRLFCPVNGFAILAVLLLEMHPGGRIYRVDDPASVKTRVEFVTNNPIQVAVIARKITLTSATVTPLQSDYQAIWKGANVGSSSKLRRETLRILSQIRTLIGRRFYLPWQNRGITALTEQELYSLHHEV